MTRHTVNSMNSNAMDEFLLDVIRDAFDDSTKITKDLSHRLAELNRELGRLEAVLGHNEYIIHEEEEIF